MSLITRLRHQLTRRTLIPPIGFVHIPKAAGTATVQQLDSRLRPRRSVYRLDRSQFGSFTAFETMAKSMQAGLVLDAQPLLAQADIIAGHLSPSTIRQHYPSAHLITILRAPQPRLISHWFYWRGYSDQVLDEFGDWGSAIALSRLELAEFLDMRRIACVTDNIILRMLLWPHSLIPDDDFIAPDHEAILLAAARRVLADFAFVGITETADSGQQLNGWLQKTYGISAWARIEQLLQRSPVIAANQSKIPVLKMQTSLTSQIDGPASAALRARTRLDDQLWQDIAQRYFGQADIDKIYHKSMSSCVHRYETLDKQAPDLAF